MDRIALVIHQKYPKLRAGYGLTGKKSSRIPHSHAFKFGENPL